MYLRAYLLNHDATFQAYAKRKEESPELLVHLVYESKVHISMKNKKLHMKVSFFVLLE